MKQKLKIAVAGLAALLITSMFSANAATFGPIGVQEGALWGANYLVQISKSDLTNTTTNVAQTISTVLNVSSNTGVEFVALVVDTAADSGNTNYTGSTLLKIGDGDDDDRYLTSTELNVDGTEVLYKYGPPNSATVTASTTNLVYLNASSNVVTNTLTVAVTAAGTIGELSRRVYTANDTVDFVITPNAEESVSALSNLSFRTYWKLTPPIQ